MLWQQKSAMSYRRSENIEYLANRRFPRAEASRRNLAERPFGRGGWRFPGATTEEMDEADAYRAELAELDDATLSKLADEERTRATAEVELALAAADAAAFFGQPEAMADCGHWGKAAYWTIEEGVTLVLGRDPRVVTVKKVSSHPGGSHFVGAYLSLHDLAQRALAVGDLGKTNFPAFFLAWSMRMGIEPPVELIAEVESMGSPIADWKTIADGLKEKLATVEAQIAKEVEAKLMPLLEKIKSDRDTALSTIKTLTDRALEAKRRNEELGNAVNELVAERDAAERRSKELEDQLARTDQPDAMQPERPLIGTERQSALKLILGMALAKYRYQVTDKRSEKHKKIADDLELVGLSIDPDTVRRWLTEARKKWPDAGTK